ncbi:hypothetical protein J0895_01475 [Phormidium pseudopriestleyi FRX01]|uniref:Uncharacterized protein n=1 Tax=Phormidium pseudopriestleyi FRX01 TaxID=1759528 RepID=A0ABS3FLD0_9CYAN|nr:hypothetical protein [Phormidium pseudopriestleyi]MBO0347799.1 hypothetical protein [Phormidium pseudopriestleyi FRX01]
MRLNLWKSIGVFSSLGFLFVAGIMSANARDLGIKPLPKQQSVQISQNNLGPVSGQWTLAIEVTAHTDLNVSTEPNYWMLTSLEQSGIELSGRILNVNQNACSDAEILGKVEGNRVSWIMYYTGSCCKDGMMKFEGVMVSPTTIEGTLVPVGSSPQNCTLWSANVVATQGHYYK